jgi:hypothetical protein
MTTLIQDSNIPEDINTDTILEDIARIKSIPSIKEKIHLITALYQQIAKAKTQLNELKLISMD